MKWIIAYLAAALAFGVLDFLWLRWAAPNLYRPVIGSIMAEDFRKGAALAFYVIYIGGMVYFAVRPALADGQISTAVLNGAILGALCYATYDLTSQAVLKVWATHVSLADIAWGAFATAVASGAAAWAAIRMAG